VTCFQLRSSYIGAPRRAARAWHSERCQAHMTDTDRQALDDLHIAVLAASEAEERWRDARLRVREAECAAGVRRANPDLK
jgi:hypothetical protein